MSRFATKEELLELLNLYERLYNDPYSHLYKDDLLTILIARTKESIVNLDKKEEITLQ